jgi:MFS family permease
VWIILLSPVFAVMWTRLGNRAPSTPHKFAYGVIGMGATFLLFLPMAGTTGKAVPALLIVGIMAAFAISELMISPIGLAVTTQLAPRLLRHHRSRGDRRGRRGSRHLRLDKPPDGGRALSSDPGARWPSGDLS